MHLATPARLPAGSALPSSDRRPPRTSQKPQPCQEPAEAAAAEAAPCELLGGWGRCSRDPALSPGLCRQVGYLWQKVSPHWSRETGFL